MVSYPQKHLFVAIHAPSMHPLGGKRKMAHLHAGFTQHPLHFETAFKWASDYHETTTTGAGAGVATTASFFFKNGILSRNFPHPEKVSVVRRRSKAIERFINA